MSLKTQSADRLRGLAAALDRRNAEAVFCTSAVTMSYLADYHEEGGERLLTLVVKRNGECTLIAPSLARTQAERAGFSDIRTWRDGEDPMGLVKRLGQELGLSGKTVAVEDEMRASILLGLQDALPSTRFVAGQPVISDLMRRKDAHELALLRRAGEIADNALAPTMARMKVGMSEYAVHESLTHEMQVQGCKPNFCIVGTGANGAEPHHMTDGTKLKAGDVVVMDYGCVVEGYMSDITRTVVMGPPSEEQAKVYRVVYDAHMAARDAIRPGVPAEDIDMAARQVIERAGYGEFFVHRTGHGLGRRIHEEPYICAGNTEALEVGNVFSIEPGIYLPGQFGVRIENIVAVTDDGHYSLNADPSPTILSVSV